ncbi:MAG: DUF5596 domain-containing protein [Clostridia bacterium]|nr:DUF5596 domain-containing protein [Clostridia bacterium]
MLNLAKELQLSPELISKLEKLNKEKIFRLCEKCFSKSFSVLKTKNHIIRLAVILTAAVKLKKQYEEKGIDRKIFLSTLSDIKIWCEENENRGLKNSAWLQNHVKGELFRLGRLQFQLYVCNNSTLNYKKLPFSYGENLVYVHIPKGEKLLQEDCIDSLKQATAFFEKYFPEFRFRYYFCESWLLFQGNKDFMEENSNILKFADLFDHRYSLKIDFQAIERIFGKRRLRIKSYPEKTSLQKRAKNYLLSSNKLGIGVGVIDKNLYK